MLEWLDFAYPRTPVLIVTGGPEPLSARRFCEGRDLHFQEKPVSRAALEQLIREHFAPWDRRTREARRSLLAMAGGHAAEMTEPLLRLADAYLQSVPLHRLGAARGVSDKSAAQSRRDLEALLGASLDAVRASRECRMHPRGAWPVRHA